MRFIRWLPPALTVLLFLTSCQRQPEEIGLTAVSAEYLRQHAQHQNDSRFAEQNAQTVTALIKEVVNLRFNRAGEQLAQHLTPECRERMIAVNQKQGGTDYGLSRLGTLETCEILTLSDHDALVQITCSYGDTPQSYTLALRLVSADETWLVDQMQWSEDPPKQRGRIESADQLVQAYQEAILARDYARLANLYQVPWDPEGLLFWSTVDIADSEIIAQKIQTDQACYQLKITVDDPGMSQLSKGTSAVWLWCRRIRQGEEIQTPGWTIEGLMSQQPPQSWWSE